MDYNREYGQQVLQIQKNDYGLNELVFNFHDTI